MEESLKFAIVKFVNSDADGIISPPVELTSSQIEGLIGFKIPRQFHEWLIFANGCYCSHGGIHGIKTTKPVADLLDDLSVYPQWRSRSWLPVGYDAFGNIFVLDCSLDSPTAEFVSFFDLASSEDVPVALVASSFEEFLGLYLSDKAKSGDWPTT